MTWILFLFLPLFFPFPVKGSQIQGKIQDAKKICSAYGYQVLEAKFGQENHLLCLKLQAIGSSHLASNSSALFLDPESKNSTKGFRLADVTMAFGFPVENPSSGSAEGYVGDDHNFYGVLHLGNRTLHADPYGKDNPDNFFGVLENDNMAAPERSRRDHDQLGAGFYHLPYFPYRIEQRKHQPGVASARICDLLLLADKEFFEKDANASLNQVVRRMMHAVAQADLIFRNADFNEDGVPDNIGFSVKYILVLTSDETNSRVFGDLAKDRAVDGRNYLMRFARLRRLSEVCLGVAFSGHAFYNRTLGLSFTSLGGGMGGAAGGLCDRRASGRSFNTLALAHATVELHQRVPERISALTLAHEIGHSFGAHHDDRFPNPECQGYIMGSQSTPTSSHHFEFSLCSKRLIAATLSSMSYCLSEVDKPFCGNGVVENGEACDCGLPSHCMFKDPCCTPRAGGALAFEEGALHKEGCSVAPKAACHPSQGLCCNANCEYANLTASGIECRMLERQCTCALASGACRCGLGGRCLPDRTCHAADCALLGLRECRCQPNGPGGKLRKARMCGVCCQIDKDDKSLCVGVEYAAKMIMADTELPEDWPDEDYRGPNMTLRICGDRMCRSVEIRAWPPGGACVSMNVVGICSPRGLCKMVVTAPTSNIYPDVMRVKVMKQSARASKNESVIFLSIFLAILCNSVFTPCMYCIQSLNINK
ncbi:disintegrin and metalloproteinase domain-containing protein 10-like [Vanessa cardui]|uniref:disintegrin and metalloproteinase domain-containing protein 10-like n=1 Tax=Vanessa cardui TaxID=171605 RepID=UPI001F12A79E|nr:disintegrin and metalloproteinase domain-containing protein 10-like [Vanessa cardui]